MKPVTVSLVFVTLFTLSLCVSPPVVPNTRAEGCFEGTCGPHCAWDGVKIFAGDALNQPGKCRLLTCSKEFDIHISPCPFDISGEYKWVAQDNKKLYPECCGTKTKINSH